MKMSKVRQFPSHAEHPYYPPPLMSMQRVVFKPMCGQVVRYLARVLLALALIAVPMFGFQVHQAQAKPPCAYLQQDLRWHSKHFELEFVGGPGILTAVTERKAQEYCEALELAYEQLVLQMGFKLPSNLRSKRIVVKVKKGHSTEGTAHHFYFSRSYVTLDADLSGYLLKTAAHELFHLVQRAHEGVKPDWNHWVDEGTAEWAADQVLTPSQDDYLERNPGWIIEVKRGTPFSGDPASDDPLSDRNKLTWYGSSALFAWWARNLQGNRKIIKEVIAEVPSALTKTGVTETVAKILAAHSDAAVCKNEFPCELLRAVVGGTS